MACLHDARALIPVLGAVLFAVAAAAPASARAQQPEFPTALLTLEDLPSGWGEITEQIPPDAVNTDALAQAAESCPVAADTVQPEPLAQEYAAFLRRPSSGIAESAAVAHVVTRFTPDDAARAIAAVRAFVSTCSGSRTITQGESEVSVQITPLDLSVPGDEIVAFQSRVDGGFLTAVGEIVLIRRGDLVALLTHLRFSLGPVEPDTELTEKLARRAGEQLTALAGSR